MCRRPIIFVLLAALFLGEVKFTPFAYAGETVSLIMPAPGHQVALSPAFIPAHLKGITINPDNALQFDFLIHKGEGQLDENQKQEEYNKLVKYFLASLTIADNDQWVNLSPYEEGRIIENNFGKTEMGRDLLSQDYLLKQITSSLMYPESGLGKTFWDKVYAKAYKEYGHTNIPVNTFNKVWIVPDEAVVYEKGNTAYIVKSHLKVMLEEDYLSKSKHISPPLEGGARGGVSNASPPPTLPPQGGGTMSSQIIREIIIPELEKEVNEGKNFALLRQIYSGMVLATWYKKVLKESLLGQVYADKAKTEGVELSNMSSPNALVGDPEHIYQQYLTAFKKGTYNYIKSDEDKYTKQIIPRKYFAGGFKKDLAMVIVTPQTIAASSTIIAEHRKVFDQVDAASVVLSPDIPEITMADKAMHVEMITVNRGHDLRSLAASYQMTETEIIKLNRLTTTELRVGQRLKMVRVFGQRENEIFMRHYNALLTRESMPIEEIFHADERGRIVRNLQEDDQLEDDKFMPVDKSELLRTKKWELLVLLWGRFVAVPSKKLMKKIGLMSFAMVIDIDREIDRLGREISNINPNNIGAGQREDIDDLKSKAEDLVAEAESSQNHSRLEEILKELRVIWSNILQIARGVGTQATRARGPRGIGWRTASNSAMIEPVGGIDLNSSNLDLLIKRDGRGVPLPVAQQDMAQLQNIRGFSPTILEIRSLAAPAIFD